MERSSGILLPIFSLPSPYGVGTLGKSARDFVRFLARAGVSWWQVLPLGPTSYGDSPYQSFSTFAGNPYFIDLDQLRRDKLLTPGEILARPWGDDPRRVDYGALYRERLPLLRLAYARARAPYRAALAAFQERHRAWLPDYALFMALKAHFQMRPWMEWPADIRLRRPEALERYRAELSEETGFHVFLQYLFYTQWQSLKDFAHQNGVQIIGDLPIYVAMDSADVWAAPEFFQLDEHHAPTAVAGVPPDYFSETGQLWGNPLYDWAAMERDGYGWWLRRMDCAMQLFDLTRIDHFRGLASYWAVPYGAETAENGRWEPGPGLPFLERLRGWFGSLPILAEDLGVLTPDVEQLLRDSGLPGMKVLQFAFAPGENSAYLPHNHIRNCVCYTGTHDNTTLADWAAHGPRRETRFAAGYLGLSGKTGLDKALLRAGMASVADLFVAQLQDYLGLPAAARINTPGTTGGNWTWRLTPGQLPAPLAGDIRRLNQTYSRLPAPKKGPCQAPPV